MVESEKGESQVVKEIVQIEREVLQPENLGLSLVEAKTLLQNVQRTLVEQQVSEYEAHPNVLALLIVAIAKALRGVQPYGHENSLALLLFRSLFRSE